MSNNKLVKVENSTISEFFEFSKYTPNQLATRIKSMISNGKALNDNEAMSLAVYAMATQLNPFKKECWYIPGVGPTVGINGYRRKGQEQYRIELAEMGETQGKYSIDFQPATHDEAVFEEGDIAWKATLIDHVARDKYMGKLILTAQKLKELGVKEPFEEAKKGFGPPPEWWAVGVVSKDENFSGVVYEGNRPTDKRKPEMWDRNERAKKRAEKNVLQMRFSGMEFGGATFVDSDSAFVEADIEEIENKPKGNRHDQIMDELGFDPEPEKKKEAEPETIEGDFKEDLPESLQGITSWDEFHKAAEENGVEKAIADAIRIETKDLEKAVKGLIRFIPPGAKK